MGNQQPNKINWRYIMKRYTKNRTDLIYTDNYIRDEIFMDVTEDAVPGVYDYYKVSNYGNVYHTYLKIIMSPGIDSNGYPFVAISTEYGVKHMSIHRLVMLTFCPIQNSDMLQVNHKNGIKTDNRLLNLEWCTRSENIMHAYKTGLHKKGEDVATATITNAQAIQIRDLLATNKYSCIDIASMVGAPVHTVNDIKKKSSWKYITEGYEFEHRPGKLYDDQMVRNLCIYFENTPINDLTVNKHVYNALKYYGYDTSDRYVDSARKIYNKKYYKNIVKDYNF